MAWGIQRYENDGETWFAWGMTSKTTDGDASRARPRLHLLPLSHTHAPMYRHSTDRHDARTHRHTLTSAADEDDRPTDDNDQEE